MEIFGFLTLGTIIGWLSYRVLGKRGMRMLPSVIIGAVSAIIGGLVVMIFGLAGSGYYAAITSLGTLFTINAFKKREPIFPEPEN